MYVIIHTGSASFNLTYHRGSMKIGRASFITAQAYTGATSMHTSTKNKNLDKNMHIGRDQCEYWY